MTTRTRPSRRRGSYAILLALALTVLLGFGAFAIDVAYIRMAQAQAQDVADAATQAAVIMLRRTGSQDDARTVAEGVVAANLIAGQPGDLADLDFGTWDEDAGTFTEGTVAPNAVRALVTRTGDNEVGLFLARFFGVEHLPVAGRATSAARAMHVCVAFDITNSWNHSDFHNATDAALAFYDVIANNYGEQDKIGMAIFTGPFAWEYTPLTRVADDVAAGKAVRDDWEILETGNKAGKYKSSSNKHCTWATGSNKNNFKTNTSTTTKGGCFSEMPREYQDDEAGTDHTTGLEMCSRMFEAEDNPGVYRAVLMLTDGIPNGTQSTAGTLRAADGYTETRWTEYKAAVPHSTTNIKTDSVALAGDMWDEQQANIWVVSFVQYDSFMESMVQGDGYFTLTSDSSALVDIFEGVANSLPLAIVE